jgi:hypothetical protein
MEKINKKRGKKYGETERSDQRKDKREKGEGRITERSTRSLDEECAKTRLTLNNDAKGVERALCINRNGDA